MDASAIISLVSVGTSFVITIANIIIGFVDKKQTAEKQHQHELEIEKIKHQYQSQDKLREEQYRVVSDMAPLGIIMSENPDEGREDLYALALHLAACSNLYDQVGESATQLLNALTKDFQKNKNKILWTMLIESCARSINYQPADTSAAGK